MTRREFGLRACVIAAAPIATALAAPWPVTAGLGLATLANTGELLTAVAPHADRVTRWLLAGTGVAVLLILLGLLLNEAPGGLTATSWQIGWAAVSAVALLVVRGRVESRLAFSLSIRRSLVVPFAVLLAFVPAGLVLGAAGVRMQNGRPLLELSTPTHSASRAQVVVHSVDVGGSYALQVIPDGEATEASQPQPVTLAALRTQSLSFALSLPVAERYWKVVLRALPSQTVERELILWK